MLRSIPLTISSIALLSSCLLGCASYGDVRFRPNPMDVRVARSEDTPRLASALVSVRGIEKASEGSEGEGSWEIVVRIRIENEADGELSFPAGESELLDGGLSPFSAPRVSRLEPASDDSLRLAPGETGVFDLRFPFPPGRGPEEVDLSGLSLRWSVEVDGALLRVSSLFELAPPTYADYGYRYGYGYGYGGYYDCYPWGGPYHYAYHGAYPYR